MAAITGIATGFETGDNKDILTLTVNGGATCAVQSAVTRGAWSTYALRYTGTTSSSQTGSAKLATRPPSTGALNGNQVITGSPTVVFRIYFRVDTLPSAGTTAEFFAVGGIASTIYCVFRIKGDGTIGAWNATNTTQIGSQGTIALSTGTWYRLEFKVGSGTGAVVEWKVDGTTDVSTTSNLNTVGITGCYLGQRTSSGGNAATLDFYYDDILAIGSTYIGPGRSVLVPVDGDGTYQNWTPTGGPSTHWQCVNDIPVVAATYLLSNLTNTSPESETLASCASAGISGTVNIAGPLCVVQRDGGTNGAFRVRLRSASTNVDMTGNGSSPATAAAMGVLYDADPATAAAWTTAGIDGCEVGLTENSVTNRTRFCGAFLVVDYEPSSLATATPGTASVAITASAPTASGSGTASSSPGTTSVALTATAPAGTPSGHATATPGIATVVLTATAATASTPVTASAGSAVVGITAIAAAATATGTVTVYTDVSPDQTARVTVNVHAATVSSGAATAVPASATIAISVDSPAATPSGHATATPGLGAVTVTATSPAVSGSGTGTGAPVTATVAISGVAPASAGSGTATANPGTASVLVTGIDVSATAGSVTLTPGTATVTIAAVQVTAAAGQIIALPGTATVGISAADAAALGTGSATTVPGSAAVAINGISPAFTASGSATASPGTVAVSILATDVPTSGTGTATATPGTGAVAVLVSDVSTAGAGSAPAVPAAASVSLEAVGSDGLAAGSATVTPGMGIGAIGCLDAAASAAGSVIITPDTAAVLVAGIAVAAQAGASIVLPGLATVAIGAVDVVGMGSGLVSMIPEMVITTGLCFDVGGFGTGFAEVIPGLATITIEAGFTLGLKQVVIDVVVPPGLLIREVIVISSLVQAESISGPNLLQSLDVGGLLAMMVSSSGLLVRGVDVVEG